MIEAPAKKAAYPKSSIARPQKNCGNTPFDNQCAQALTFCMGEFISNSRLHLHGHAHSARHRIIAASPKCLPYIHKESASAFSFCPV
jgi:hypothetical protein